MALPSKACTRRISEAVCIQWKEVCYEGAIQSELPQEDKEQAQAKDRQEKKEKYTEAEGFQSKKNCYEAIIRSEAKTESGKQRCRIHSL
jgi:hypothetical protein